MHDRRDDAGDLKALYARLDELDGDLVRMATRTKLSDAEMDELLAERDAEVARVRQAIALSEDAQARRMAVTLTVENLMSMSTVPRNSMTSQLACATKGVASLMGKRRT